MIEYEFCVLHLFYSHGTAHAVAGRCLGGSELGRCGAGSKQLEATHGLFVHLLGTAHNSPRYCPQHESSERLAAACPCGLERGSQATILWPEEHIPHSVQLHLRTPLVRRTRPRPRNLIHQRLAIRLHRHRRLYKMDTNARRT